MTVGTAADLRGLWGQSGEESGVTSWPRGLGGRAGCVQLGGSCGHYRQPNGYISEACRKVRFPTRQRQDMISGASFNYTMSEMPWLSSGVSYWLLRSLPGLSMIYPAGRPAFEAQCRMEHCRFWYICWNDDGGQLFSMLKSKTNLSDSRALRFTILTTTN